MESPDSKRQNTGARWAFWQKRAAANPAGGSRTLQRREAIAFHLFISPWLIGLIAFTLVPFAASAYLSLTYYEVLLPPKWVGLRNYVDLFQDRLIYHSLKVTAIYAVGSVSLGTVAAFSLALLMNQKVFGINLLRTLYYLPSTLSGVPVALLWMWIFSPNFGLLNKALAVFGIEGPQWLFDRTWVLPSLILMSLWGAGGGMVIYLAGLQSIPHHLYEAAELDGAGGWRKFRHITIPMMTPVLFFNLVTSIIMAFRTFTNAYVMTGGGPAHASLFYVLYLFRKAFTSHRMGYACAMAWVLAAIVMVLTVVLFRSSSRWVYYASGE